MKKETSEHLLAEMDSIRKIQDLDKKMILDLIERVSNLEEWRAEVSRDESIAIISRLDSDYWE